MDGLRWILLGAGILVVALVYAVTRWQLSRRNAAAEAARRAAQPPPASPLAGEPDEDTLREELARMESLVGERSRDEAPPADGEQLIRLSVMAPPGVPFDGATLAQALARAGLAWDEALRVYHRLDGEGAAARPVFSVTSAVKPGSFDWDDEPAAFRTPGISLFLALPGPVEGVRAFDDMLATAERLAAELGGELQDPDHSVLTRQTAAHLREGIIEARVRARARPPA